MALVGELDSLPCDGCKDCPLAAGWKDKDGNQCGGYARPHGPANAPVLVVGEAPRKDEVIEGELFAGGAGNTLKSTLKGVGIDPAVEVRYVAVAHCRTPTVRGKDQPPEPLVQAKCTLLERELEAFEGKVVVPLGRVATDRLLSRATTSKLLKSRSSWDGYIFEWDSDYSPPSDVDLGYGYFDEGEVYKSGKNKGKPKMTKRMLKGIVPRPRYAQGVIPAISPVSVQLRGFSTIGQFRAGLLRAKYVLEGRPTIKGPDMTEVITDPSKWEIFSDVDDNRPKELIFDIEDSGVAMTRVGFLEMYEDGRFGRMGTFQWNAAAQTLTERLVTEGTAYSVILAHNGDYDCGRLEEWYDIMVDKKKMLDTMHAAQIQQPDLPKGLGSMWRYIQSPMYPWKQESQDNPAFYNMCDCLYTAAAWRSLRHLLMMKGQIPLLITQTQGSFTLGAMTRHGIRRDMPKVEKWLEGREIVLEGLTEKWTQQTAEIAGKPVATSGKNLTALLYDEMKLPVLDWTATDQPSTSEDVIEKLIANDISETANELLQSLLTVRRARKEISTYVKSFAERTDERGYLHPSYLPDIKDAGDLGTAAGRLSSSPNIQNIPSAMKWQFIPDADEWVIGDSDLSAVENRVTAASAGDVELLALMDDDTFDPHTHNLNLAKAALLEYWQGCVDGTTKATGQQKRIAKRRLEGVELGGWPITRRTMKTFIYGWQYGAGDRTIAKQLSITIKEAAVIREAYETWRPVLTDHRKNVVLQARQKKHLQNVFGRIRYFYGAIPDTHVQNAAINFGPQSTVADMFWQWFPVVHEVLRSHEGHLCTQVHDSFVWTAHKDKVEEITVALTQVMNCEWPSILEGFRVPVNHQIGDTWGTLHDLDDWRDNPTFWKDTV